MLMGCHANVMTQFITSVRFSIVIPRNEESLFESLWDASFLSMTNAIEGYFH